jgi:hypothetical protein
MRAKRKRKERIKTIGMRGIRKRLTKFAPLRVETNELAFPYVFIPTAFTVFSSSS